MESITTGLYKNPLNVLREYISNEIDTNPPPTEIDVKVETRKLLISGNGPGMDFDGIRDAVKVGFSPKDATKNIGFRGIGIYSGTAICNKIVITTKKKINPNYYQIVIDCDGLREDIRKKSFISLIESLNKNIRWKEIAAPKEKVKLYGTAVELIDILEDFEEDLGEESIKKYLEMTIPLEFEPSFRYKTEIYEFLKNNLKNDSRVVKLKVNNIPIYRAPKYPTLEKPTFGKITDKRKALGVYWICQNADSGKIDDENSRGLVYRKKGFTVGDRTTISKLFLGETDKHLIDHVAGEIHITTDELLPNTERVEFEASPARYTVEQKLTKDIKKQISEMARNKSAILKADERIVKAQSLPNKPKFESNDEWLDEITDAKKLLHSLENDLKNKRIPKGTKNKIERVHKRVKTYIKNNSTPPKEEISNTETKTEISEKVSSNELKTEVASTEDNIVKENEGYPSENISESKEEEIESSEWLPSAVEDMCNRIGHSEWMDVTLKFIEVLKNEVLLKNDDEIKSFLHKLELKLVV